MTREEALEIAAIFNAKGMTKDPRDPMVIEDPRDTSKILVINLIPGGGNSAEQARAVAEKIQTLLGTEKFVVSDVEFTGSYGVLIFGTESISKSTGILSKMDGVPVGFQQLTPEDFQRMTAKAPASTPKPPAM